jgi:hypothetical protein
MYVNCKYSYKDNENKSLIVILNCHNILHKYYKLIHGAKMGISVCRNITRRITTNNC